MTPENFCYWLQGFLELHQRDGVAYSMTSEQVMIVREHLQLAMKKVTLASSFTMEPLARETICRLTC